MEVFFLRAEFQNVADLGFVQIAGALFSVAGDERDGRAFGGKFEDGFDLERLEIERGGDEFDVIGNGEEGGGVLFGHGLAD